MGHHGGVRPVEQGEGDSIVAAFSRASDALAAALEAQLGLTTQAWPGGLQLRVRIALHTAEAQLRGEGNYFGLALNRWRGIANGGQTLLSRAVYDLALEGLPDGVVLVDLGTHRLRDLGRPEHVFALSHPDLPASPEPLRSLDALPNNLPQQLTSFVGRERELSEVAQARLRSCCMAVGDVTVMATSRAPLGVAGEADWRVPSLSLPSERRTEPVEAVAQSDAVRLFIERALKVRPNFTVDAANAPAIA